MKAAFIGMLGFSAMLSCGCNEGVPGGSSVKRQHDNQPIIGTADETFTLGVPLLSTSLNQGETESIDISISRGKNVDADVTLSFSNVPKGLTISPARPVIKHGEEKTTVTLAAAVDAAVGEFVVKVNGQPSNSGAAAVQDLKVSIAKP